MPSRSSLNVSLTLKLERFVHSRVVSGHYQTASEVIREGLRLLEIQERDRDLAYKELKAKLQRGAAQAERSKSIDGNEFFDHLRAHISRKKSGRKKARTK